MAINLSNIQRCDPRTFVGAMAVRMPGKSMRLARVRRNRQIMDAGQMLRPRWNGSVHHEMNFETDRQQMRVQREERWIFRTGDLFPSARHGELTRQYGDVIHG